MLSEAEAQYVFMHAWVPEHLVDYVVAVSGKEPFLLGDHLCYVAADTVAVVGYPLSRPFPLQELVQLLEEIRNGFRPREISLLAPEIPSWRGLEPKRPKDHYFRLELGEFRLESKVRNMLKRASRELEVHEGNQMERAHEDLLEEFLAHRDLSKESQAVLRALPRYVRIASPLVLSALGRRGRLVAFSVGHMAGGDYGFYMFNVSSKTWRVPGGSDLLLHALVERARKEGKRFLNLGLGIGPGVRFFKEKWGANPFVPYLEANYSSWSLGRLMGSLLKGPLEGHRDA